MRTGNPNKLLNEVEVFVHELLNELNPGFSFHNIAHTTDVVTGVKIIGNGMNLSFKEIQLLQIAGWFHDTGFTVTYDRHEQESKKIAESFLSNKNYPDHEIAIILRCIGATNLLEKPTNLCEKIICDADLIHLSSDNYLIKLNSLRNEWNTILNKTYTDLHWLEENISFLANHHFHTDFAREHFTPGVNKNLSNLKNLLCS